MIGTSKAEFAFIRACIIGLHYIVPLCLLYCIGLVALQGFKATTYRFPLVVESIVIAETLFYLCVYIPFSHVLQREAVHPNAPTREERRELFQLCNDNISDPEAYLQKWFLGAPADEIKRENVKEFFLWAFFNRGGTPGEDEDELDEYIDATEKLLGRPIEEGRGKALCLRLTLDRVSMLHRSLIWYTCVGFVDFLTYLKLLFNGFHFHRTSLSRFFTLFPFRPQTLLSSYRSPAMHTTYWHRPHTSTTKLPVVFIHGIGIGLYPYTSFLTELNSNGGIETSDPIEQVGIIAIEVMPVSFRITHHALGREEMCAEIDQIISHHFPNQKYVLASHSYGTVISTHLLKTPRIAERIGPMVLIDPVSILLHLPDVAFNFTRRQPKHANEHQLYYFASMDMGVSHTLARHFFWNENILWKKDIGTRKVTVSLGARDLIVNTEAVGRYLSDEPAKFGYKDGSLSQDGSDAILINLEGDDISASTSEVRMCEGNGTDSEALGDGEKWKYRARKGTGIDVLWFKELDHAQVFDRKNTRGRVIQAIHHYCENGDD